MLPTESGLLEYGLGLLDPNDLCLDVRYIDKSCLFDRIFHLPTLQNRSPQARVRKVRKMAYSETDTAKSLSIHAILALLEGRAW